MRDIETKEDIDELVKLFYDKLFEDDLLKEIFENTVRDHLDKHIDLVSQFWDSILLDIFEYKNNVIEKHISADRLFTLKKREFDRWLLLWKASVDELFKGEKAELAKSRAASIADLMLYKLEFIRKTVQ
ncbi:MAG: group III truncated hemoglobin [Chitinophagales bacterium]|nr:group III truncated hemoglobin [Bacteroidota bacterium]